MEISSNRDLWRCLLLDKTFYEMIFKRKSFHIFRSVGNESIIGAELDDIQNAYTAFIPLNAEIKTTIRIVPEKQTNCKRGGEYCILLYSEKKTVIYKTLDISVNNSTFTLYHETSERSGLE